MVKFCFGSMKNSLVCVCVCIEIRSTFSLLLLFVGFLNIYCNISKGKKSIIAAIRLKLKRKRRRKNNFLLVFFSVCECACMCVLINCNKQRVSINVSMYCSLFQLHRYILFFPFRTVHLPLNLLHWDNLIIVRFTSSLLLSAQY